MADSDIPTEALEAAARAIAEVVPRGEHGACPVNGDGVDVTACECWVYGEAQDAARAAAPHLIEAGRKAHWEDLARQALADQPGVDETPALMTKVEALVRAKVAAEIREHASLWCMDGTGRHLIDNVVRIAEGGTDG